RAAIGRNGRPVPSCTAPRPTEILRRQRNRCPIILPLLAPQAWPPAVGPLGLGKPPISKQRLLRPSASSLLAAIPSSSATVPSASAGAGNTSTIHFLTGGNK